MSSSRKLNGWQRLWVVVSVIALLYAIGLGIFGGIPPRVEYEVVTGFRNSSCDAVIRMPSGGKLNPEPRYDDPCRNLYGYRSTYEAAKDTEAGYIEHMTTKQNIYIAKNVGFLLAVWLICMALLYGGGVVAAWILRGFRSNDEK